MLMLHDFLTSAIPLWWREYWADKSQLLFSLKGAVIWTKDMSFLLPRLLMTKYSSFSLFFFFLWLRLRIYFVILGNLSCVCGILSANTPPITKIYIKNLLFWNIVSTTFKIYCFRFILLVVLDFDTQINKLFKNYYQYT